MVLWQGSALQNYAPLGNATSLSFSQIDFGGHICQTKLELRHEVNVGLIQARVNPTSLTT